MVNKTHQATEETVKSSSLKPKLRIKRNNMGSWVIFLFGMVFDLVNKEEYFSVSFHDIIDINILIQ